MGENCIRGVQKKACDRMQGMPTKMLFRHKNRELKMKETMFRLSKETREAFYEMLKIFGFKSKSTLFEMMLKCFVASELTIIGNIEKECLAMIDIMGKNIKDHELMLEGSFGNTKETLLYSMESHIDTKNKSEIKLNEIRIIRDKINLIKKKYNFIEKASPYMFELGSFTGRQFIDLQLEMKHDPKYHLASEMEE
jgi:hypothetical protein